MDENSTSNSVANSLTTTIVSRDEMNLAEFPVSILSTRSDPTVKTLEFRDSVTGKNGELVKREWIITGADKFGLPTASDDEVLLGLLKLTVDQAFSNAKIYFTRYELLKILRWTTEGRSYQRLQNAFDRLSGVRIKATNAFFDNESKSHSTKNFGIIDAYEINDGRELTQKPSFFIWSEEIFKSFQAGFIKKIDLDLYLNLKSAISKRLYRFLDKHFWYKAKVKINLFILAHEKIGISRNYKYVSSLRQQLDLAADELIERGFLSSYEYAGHSTGTEIIFHAAMGQPRYLQKSQNDEGIPKDIYQDNSARNNAQKSANIQHQVKQRQGISQNALTAERKDFSESTGQKSANNEMQLAYEKIFSMLVDRGLNRTRSQQLLNNKSFEDLDKIEKIIMHYDNLLASQNKLLKSPLGFLSFAVERSDTFVLPGTYKNSKNGKQIQEPIFSKSTYQSQAFQGGGANQTGASFLRGNAVGDKSSIRESDMWETGDRNAKGYGISGSNQDKKRPSNTMVSEYNFYRKKRIEDCKNLLEPLVYADMEKEIETEISKSSLRISKKRLPEIIRHKIDEKIAGLFAIESFQEWYGNQKNGLLNK